jgi:hypothetical protein
VFFGFFDLLKIGKKKGKKGKKDMESNVEEFLSRLKEGKLVEVREVDFSHHPIVQAENRKRRICSKKME